MAERLRPQGPRDPWQPSSGPTMKEIEGLKSPQDPGPHRQPTKCPMGPMGQKTLDLVGACGWGLWGPRTWHAIPRVKTHGMPGEG